MSATQNTGKARRYQVYPKCSSRDVDPDDSPSNNSRGPEQVPSRAEGRERLILYRTTSWRYHPRPRDVARPHSEKLIRYHPRPRELVRPQSEKSMGAAAAAAAAAAVPPSWLKSNSGADLLQLAAGVRGDSSGSGTGRSSATRTRSLSDSTAAVSSSASSSSSKSVASLAREARRQQQQRGKQEEDMEERKEPHENHRVPHDEQPRALVARELSGADQSCDTKKTGEGRKGAEATGKREAWHSSNRSNNVLRETQPDAAGPTAGTAHNERRVQLFPSWLSFGSRRRTRPREETSAICDSQDPPPAAAAPLPSSKAKRSFRSTIGSSLRHRKRASKTWRGKVEGKAVVAAAALACGAVLDPAQGEQRQSLGMRSWRRTVSSGRLSPALVVSAIPSYESHLECFSVKMRTNQCPASTLFKVGSSRQCDARPPHVVYCPRSRSYAPSVEHEAVPTPLGNLA